VTLGRKSPVRALFPFLGERLGAGWDFFRHAVGFSRGQKPELAGVCGTQARNFFAMSMDFSVIPFTAVWPAESEWPGCVPVLTFGAEVMPH